MKRACNDFVCRTISMIRGIVMKYLYHIKGAYRLRLYHNVRFHKKFTETNVEFGSHVSLYDDVQIYLDSEGANLHIGDHTYINQRSEIKVQSSVQIGNDCVIAWDVLIMDTDYHEIDEKGISSIPVKIGNHVWIGCRSLILKGVTIGEGAVIGAGSIVLNNVPPNTLVGGVPAKILKRNITWKR